MRKSLKIGYYAEFLRSRLQELICHPTGLLQVLTINRRASQLSGSKQTPFMKKKSARHCPVGFGELLDRVLNPDNVAHDESHQEADEAGGGHVGEGTVGEKQDHTHDDHDGGNDSTPEFPICQKILHNTLF